MRWEKFDDFSEEELYEEVFSHLEPEIQSFLARIRFDISVNSHFVNPVLVLGGYHAQRLFSFIHPKDTCIGCILPGKEKIQRK
jgi:hypothetical protein